MFLDHQRCLQSQETLQTHSFWKLEQKRYNRRNIYWEPHVHCFCSYSHQPQRHMFISLPLFRWGSGPRSFEQRPLGWWWWGHHSSQPFSSSLKRTFFSCQNWNKSLLLPTKQSLPLPTNQRSIPSSPTATTSLSIFIALHVENCPASYYLHSLTSSPVLTLFQSSFCHSFVPEPSHRGCHHVVM